MGLMSLYYNVANCNITRFYYDQLKASEYMVWYTDDRQVDRRKNARKKGAEGRELQEGKREGEEEDRGINGLIDQQKDSLTSWWINGLTEKTDQQMDGLMDQWINRRKEWMYKPTDGWTDGYIDGWTDRRRDTEGLKEGGRILTRYTVII